MRAMRDALSATPRVIVYVFGSSLLAEQEDAELIAQVQQICLQEEVRCVDTVIDRGPPKQRREEYPVLARMQRDEVDALLVVRSPFYEPGAQRDLLEAACPPGPFAWFSADELREVALLPPSAPPSRRRRPYAQAAKRARVLRGAGLPLRQIGQVLTEERYKTRSGAAWTAVAVARLLGLGVLDGGVSAETSSEATRETSSEATSDTSADATAPR